jgi:hypothetical protein
MRIGSSSQHILRVLFPLAATWALLFLFAEGIDSLQRLNPFAERSPVHNLVEEMLSWLPILFMLAAGVWVVHRWPQFLRLPPSVSPLATALRLVAHGLVWTVVVFLGTIAVGYLLHDPSRDAPEQRYLGVWMAGFMITPVIAPLATLFTVWGASRNKTGRPA